MQQVKTYILLVLDIRRMIEKLTDVMNLIMAYTLVEVVTEWIVKLKG